jgi:hypothetical protein
MWRTYQTATEVTCTNCTCKIYHLSPAIVDDFGQVHSNLGVNQSIKWHVPAIPHPDEGFWGVTGIPREELEKWELLPN